MKAVCIFNPLHVLVNKMSDIHGLKILNSALYKHPEIDPQIDVMKAKS